MSGEIAHRAGLILNSENSGYEDRKKPVPVSRSRGIWYERI